MSLLQNQDYVIHRIRTRYLQSVRDGVGERLITLNPTVFNVAGYKNAGWPNAADQGKTYSPPIPAGASTDYFMAVPRSAALDRPATFNDDEEDDSKNAAPENASGSLGIAGGFQKGAGQGRAGVLMQGQEEDSSDLSEESDLEEDLSRAAQQIKFSKMPIRQRAESSPTMSSNLSAVRQRAGSSPTMSSNPKFLITSPGKSTKTRVRSGSHGMIEYEKSKEFNSQSNDFRLLSHRIDEDTEAFKDISHKLRASPATSFRDTSEETDFDSDEDMEDDVSTMSSDFTETEDSNPGLLSGSSVVMAPIAPLFSSIANHSNGTSASLDPLPPPRPISQILPVSALTQLIKANQEEMSHPLDIYTAFSGKGDLKSAAPKPMMSRRGGAQVDENSPLRIKMYRPTSENSQTPFEIIIKRMVVVDGAKRPTSVADTIGFSLYRYREEDIKPPLDEEQYNINRWVLRIIDEDTMEADIDFPPLDRKAAISTFNLNELALVEATASEYGQNEKDTANQIVKKDNPQVSAGSPALQPAISSPIPSRPADAPTPASQTTARTGVQQILKIHLKTPEVFDQSVALRVTSDTYTAEVLDMICKKRHLDNSRHMLRLHGTNTVVPLDRTVESLQGRVDLDLVVRKFLDVVGDRPGSPSTTANPNTPLHVGMAKSNQKKSMLSQSVTASDMLLGAGYQKFTVWRKMPMSFISRHERVLAIDGDSIHIMPSDQNKTLFESPKTTSHHITSLIGCKQSRKAPNNFKLIIMKSREWKRYAFEAINAAQAAEIVEALKKQMAAYKMDKDM